jgi:putative ABC transport system permease protein
MDLGIQTSNLLTMALQLPDRKYPAIEQRLAFHQRLQERLEASSQFRAVSVTSNLPMGGGFPRRLAIDGRPLAAGEQPRMVGVVTVDPRYFPTLGLTPLRGRVFEAIDGAPGRESVVINARLAQMHFGNDDPIGRRIELSLDPGGPQPSSTVLPSLSGTIVGIVPNVPQRNIEEAERDPVAYVPFRTDPRGFMWMIARIDGDPAVMSGHLREEIRAIDPDLPLYNIRTMDQVLAQQRWPFRIFGTMFAILAAIALVLSAVGLYAVTAYSVSQRTQEIGVRTALGADSPQVMWLFLRRAFIQLAIGLTLGIGGALGVGKIFESSDLLIQVSGRDPITIVSIAGVLTIVSLIACVWPARRATRLDPVIALRHE